MSATQLPNDPRRWPAAGVSSVPAWIYTDPETFVLEQGRLFFGATWNYVALDCEVPSPGRYKRSWVGTRPVIVIRDETGQINVLENRCAHRGAMLCWKNSGEIKDFTCPYHQWNYDLRGNLLGLPFFRGAMGKGGMPRDFDKGQHGLTRLRVEVRGGVVWATYDRQLPDVSEFLGPEMRRLVDRTFSGRPLRLLGHQRQLLPCNWKVYLENSRDPYHATLLHTFFLTFGLLRTDTPFEAVPTEAGRHAIMASTYSPATAGTQNEVTRELTSLKSYFRLEDMEMVRPIDEFGDSAMINLSVAPSVFFQQHGNSLAVRHIIPKDVTSTELSWTFFGYADDDEAMRHRRLKQSNLLGPAGYVAVDDSEIVAQIQPTVALSPDSTQVFEMGGRDVSPQPTMVTETLIRGFYQFYRQQMGL